MIFSSFSFLVFFTLVLIGVFTIDWLLPAKLNRNRLRQGLLLAASYIFYGWWDWRFCILMFSLTLLEYFCALHLNDTKGKWYLCLGVLTPLVILGIFKYYNFFLSSFAAAFQIKSLHTLQIILPVGISFYTFQALSYVIDVHRNKTIAEHSLLKLMLYISFFPQLVAGPIVKAADFLYQLEENRKVEWSGFVRGIQIFTFGLFKKIVIADTLAVFVDQVFEFPRSFDSLTLILAVIAYSIQIYMDFSGYSDMAIGCAKILGYDLKINFNLPYISRNVTEFWRRWHISLSSWLQEYLYIPLGGNRKGIPRTYLNLCITMVLGGLWHGANWTFVVWGALHGLGLCIHKIWMSKVQVSRSTPILTAFSMGITYIFVCVCWIFFRADTIEDALLILSRIVSFSEGIRQIFVPAVAAILLVCLASGAAMIKSFRESKHNGDLRQKVHGFYPVLNLSRFWCLVAFLVFLGATLGLANVGSNPFIYFQF